MIKKINKLRHSIVQASYLAGEGHIPSALSILHILIVLYDRVLRIDPQFPNNPDRDRFILSKGHASLGLYAVLAEKGFFAKKHLETFGKYESILGGHPDSRKVPGVEASTGSLGHGFPQAMGMALGLKILGNSARVYTLIGDGECNEGTIWETALLASHHKLENLICIVDHNHSTDRAVSIGDIAAKFAAFDWEVRSINGHDPEAIHTAISLPHPQKPLAIIADTTKGHGISFTADNPAWHHKAPTQEEYEKITKELSE